jgi:hypothetical protein
MFYSTGLRGPLSAMYNLKMLLEEPSFSTRAIFKCMIQAEPYLSKTLNTSIVLLIYLNLTDYKNKINCQLVTIGQNVLDTYAGKQVS